MLVVCGTDFSAPAKAAARAAAALARRLRAEVALVHAFESPVYGVPPDASAELARVAGTQLELARRDLEAAAAELRAAGLSARAVFVEGSPRHSLGEVAARLKAELVVVGRRGQSAARRLVLGSTSESTAEAAPCPVFVVDDSEELTRRLESDRPLPLLAAVADDDTLDGVVAWLGRLREAIALDVTFVHVFWPPQEYQRLGLHGDVTRANVEVIGVLRHALERRIGEVPGAGSTTLIVRPSWKRIGDELAAQAERTGAELVAVGTHQRSGMSRLTHASVSREVLHAVHGSVLVVPRLTALREAPSVPQLRRVLAATDLSPQGQRAVAYAYALVGTGGGTVEVAHVTEANAGTLPHAELRGELPEPERLELERRLLELVPREAKERGVTTRVHVLTGRKPALSIVQLAERELVDAVVIGAHGHGGFKALLGSVAQEVTQRSRRPVLLVPEERS